MLPSVITSARHCWQSLFAKLRQGLGRYQSFAILIVSVLGFVSFLVASSHSDDIYLLIVVLVVAALIIYRLGNGFLCLCFLLIVGVAHFRAASLHDSLYTFEKAVIESSVEPSRGGYYRFLVIGKIDRPMVKAEIHQKQISFGVASLNGLELGSDFTLLLNVDDTPWSDISKLGQGAVVSAVIRTKVFSTQGPLEGYQRYLFRRGFFGQGYLESIKEVLSRGEPSRVQTLLSAILNKHERDVGLPISVASALGEKSLLSQEQLDVFKDLGIMHFLVVSGFHIGLLFYLCRKVFRALLSFSLTVTSFVSCNKIATLLSLIFCYFYVWKIEAGISSDRALLMLSLYTVATFTGRAAERVNVVLISFIAINVLWIEALFELGFQLSFAAIFGLLLGDIVFKELGKGRKTIVGKLLYAYLMSFSAWLMTSFVIVYHFGEVSISGPLINCIVMPIFSFAIIAPAMLSLVADMVGIVSMDALFSFSQSLSQESYFILEQLHRYTSKQEWLYIAPNSTAINLLFSAIALLWPFIGLILWNSIQRSRQNRLFGNAEIKIG